MEKSKFVAERFVFDGQLGYMVSQFVDGRVVVNQFIREEDLTWPLLLQEMEG